MEPEEKQLNLETYETNATAMAKYFEDIGARVKDIERGLRASGKEMPVVVELGCGNGRDAKEILKNTPNYVGMDFSTTMIKIAKEQNPTGEFVVADLANFEFPKNVDVIFSFASLLHSDKSEVKDVLDRAHKTLVPNGVLYISLKRGPYKKFLKEDQFGKRWFYNYEPEDILELTGNQFFEEFRDYLTISNTKWFTLVLRKGIE